MDATSAVVDLVEQVLKFNKNLTLYRIAQKCGVGYTTLRRIMQRERQASDKTVIALVTGLLPTREAAEFFNIHFPLIGKMFSIYAKGGFEVIEDESILRGLSRTEFTALVLIQARKIVNRGKLERYLGAEGEQAIDTLIDRELVRSEIGCLKPVRDELIYGSDATTLEHIEKTISLHPKNPSRPWGNAYTLRYHGVSEECLKKLTDLFFRFRSEWDDLIYDEENKGDEIVLLSMVQSILEGDFE